MKLAIKQYLSSLKESKELDAILPDLLLAMGITTTSKPQSGNRQYGVDIEAIGVDPADKKRKVFLFVLKQGNLGRKDWNDNAQSIRQSLDEIIDVYIQNCIQDSYRKLKIKIVLVTGGDMQQVIRLNWTSYVDNHTTNNIEYDFWGGDELAELYYKYLLNENLLLCDYRPMLRKTLVLLSEPSYNLNEYYVLFSKMLDSINNKKVKQRNKQIKACILVLKLVIHWAIDANNYKHAINIAEYSVLYFWNFIRQNNLFTDSAIMENFKIIYTELCTLYIKNHNRFYNLYCFPDGMHGFTNSASPEAEGIAVFEQMGFLAMVGIFSISNMFRSKNEKIISDITNVCKNLKVLIENHRSLLNPLYDSHCIEISLAAIVLYMCNETEFLFSWLSEISNHILFAYKILGKYFPVDSDSFRDLIMENNKNKENFLRSSNLFYWLLEWMSFSENEDLYKAVSENLSATSPNVCVQQWFPDEDSESKIYTTNAGFVTGYSQALHTFPKTLSEMKKVLDTKREKECSLSDFSCFQYGFPELLLLSSRHFRTPIVPDYVKQFVNDIKSVNEE